MPTFNVKPSLFIGFGGSGSLVLQRVRHDLARRFSPDGTIVPECFRFMVVDIDSSSLRMDSQLMPFNRDAGEFVCAEIGSFSSFNKNVSRANSETYRHISSWWDEKLGRLLAKITEDEEANQAYQLRRVGRAAFWLHCCSNKDFRDRFRNALNALSDTDMPGRVLASCPTLSPRREMGYNIFVVSSIAGGTGCGMIIDALANTQDMLDSIRGDTRVTTLLLLPSCYEEKEGLDLSASQVNAYAALKEYDTLYRGAVEYTEQYSDALTVKFGRRLSSLTFLVGNHDETSGTYGGDGRRVAAKISDFVYDLILGLDSEVDKGQGLLGQVVGEEVLDRHFPDHKVSRAYSAFGISEVEYPYEKLNVYTKLYSTEIILAGHTNSTLTGEEQIDIIKPILDGEDDEHPNWRNYLCPALPVINHGFLSRGSAFYQKTKRKRLVATVFRHYDEARQAIEGLLRNRQGNFDFGKFPENELRPYDNWLMSKCGGVFLRPDASVTFAGRFLEELSGRLDADAQTCRQEASDLASTLLDDEAVEKRRMEFGDLAAIWFWSNREKRLQGLLDVLKADLNTRIQVGRLGFQATACETANETLVAPLQARIRACKTHLGAAIQVSRQNKQSIRRDVTSDPFRYVGSSTEEMDELDREIKATAPQYVQGVKQALFNARFAWDESFLSSPLEVISGVVLPNGTNIFEVISKQGGDLAQELAERAHTTGPLWQIDALAGVPDVHYYMLTSVSQDRRSRLFGDIPGLTAVTVNHLGPYRLHFVSMRHGVPAARVHEVRECFEKYKASGGTVRFFGNRVDATLMADSKDWPELFPEPREGLDTDAIEDYISICREVWFDAGNNQHVLQKDDTGQHFTIFLDGGRTIRLNGLKQVREKFASDSGVVDAIADTLVKRLVAEFANAANDFLSWATGSNCPEEVASRVKKNLEIAS